MLVRMPADAKAWLESEARLNLSSQGSEIVRSVRDRMARKRQDRMMPALSYAEIAGETEPPIAEQLVTPNALRQRRCRERQAALRDTSRNAQPALRNGNADAPSQAADKAKVEAA